MLGEKEKIFGACRKNPNAVLTCDNASKYKPSACEALDENSSQ